MVAVALYTCVHSSFQITSVTFISPKLKACGRDVMHSYLGQMNELKKCVFLATVAQAFKISAPERQRQMDFCETEACLVHTASSRPARAI